MAVGIQKALVAYLKRGARMRNAIQDNEAVVRRYSSLRGAAYAGMNSMKRDRDVRASILRDLRPLIRADANSHAALSAGRMGPVMDASTASEFNRRWQSALDKYEGFYGKIRDPYFRAMEYTQDSSYRYPKDVYKFVDTLRGGNGFNGTFSKWHDLENKALLKIMRDDGSTRAARMLETHPRISISAVDRVRRQDYADALAKADRMRPRADAAQARVGRLNDMLRRYHMTNAAIGVGAGGTAAAGSLYALLRNRGSSGQQPVPAEKTAESGMSMSDVLIAKWTR